MKMIIGCIIIFIAIILSKITMSSYELEYVLKKLNSTFMYER